MRRMSQPFAGKALASSFQHRDRAGPRGQPLNIDVQDRFYSIRDWLQPFDRLSQKQYDDAGRKILEDKDLPDVSANIGASTTPVATKTVATQDPGWKVLLDTPTGALGRREGAGPLPRR